jgi:hypothetical protein
VKKGQIRTALREIETEMGQGKSNRSAAGVKIRFWPFASTHIGNRGLGGFPPPAAGRQRWGTIYRNLGRAEPARLKQGAIEEDGFVG